MNFTLFPSQTSIHTLHTPPHHTHLTHPHITHIHPQTPSLLTLPTDLEYGLPVQARDSVLNVTDTIPKSDVGREYYLQNVDKKVLVCEGVVCDVCEGMVCEGVMCGV